MCVVAQSGVGCCGVWDSGYIEGTAAAGISGTIPLEERVAADAWKVCGALVEVYIDCDLLNLMAKSSIGVVGRDVSSP